MMLAPLPLLALLAQGSGSADPFAWKEVVPRGHTIEIRGIIGSITAVAAGGREVEVQGSRTRGERGEPAAVEIQVIREGSRIIFCVIYPGDDRWNQGNDDDAGRDSCDRAQHRAPRRRGGNDTRIDFRVQVPAGVHFVGQTVTAGVSLQGLRGNAEGYSVAGDVRFTDVRGSLVDAASISGDISFDRVDAAQVYAGTLSGDVVFDGSVQRNGDYSFLTYTGELMVKLPRDAGVSLSVIAPRDNLKSSVQLTPSSTTRRSRFSGTQGSGSARMHLTTLNGEVVIRGAP